MRANARFSLAPRTIGCLLAVACGLLLPLQETVYIVFLMKVMCFAIFACAFNLLFGFTGLLSFGHAAFFGSAAYVTAYAGRQLGWTPELGILAGVACAAVLGLLFGSLAIRRKGIYFAMITLALSQIIHFVAIQAPFTGGEDGLPAARGALFGVIDLRDDRVMYYVVFAMFLLAYGFVYRLVHSPFGEVLKAIRGNEARALSLGYDVDRFKLGIFVFSASLAGLAGSLKAIVFQLATLTDVHWLTSGEVVVMVLLGGISTMTGPIVGAAIVVCMQNYLADVGAWSTIVTGLIFMVCVSVFRRGVVGECVDIVRKFAGNRRARATAAGGVMVHPETATRKACEHPPIALGG